MARVPDNYVDDYDNYKYMTEIISVEESKKRK